MKDKEKQIEEMVGDMFDYARTLVDIKTATEDGCVQFEYNGKRIIWYGAIVEIIEK